MSEEKLLDELASAYEQLSIFYDWNEELYKLSGEGAPYSKALYRLIMATSSDCGFIASFSNGMSALLKASWATPFTDIDAVFKAFKDVLSTIQDKLPASFYLQQSMDEERNLLIVPQRIGKTIDGAFVFCRGKPYLANEAAMLGNACFELSMMMEVQNSNRRLQENNNDLAFYLVKNIADIRALLEDICNSFSLVCAALKAFVPQNCQAFAIRDGRIVGSTVTGNLGLEAGAVIPEKVVRFEGDGLQDDETSNYSIRQVFDDEKLLGMTVVKTKGDASDDLLEKLHFASAKVLKNSIFEENSLKTLQKIYFSHLLGVAKLVDSMYPLLSARVAGMSQVINELSKALGLTAEEQEVLEFSSILMDASLIYLDKQTVEIYLAHGTMVATPDSLAKIREHPLKTAEMIKPVSFLEKCIPVVAAHHERFDGSGYPFGLSGNQIPFLAKLLSLAQTLVVRSIKRLSPCIDILENQQEREWFARQAGRAFDPEIIKALFEDFGMPLPSEISF